MADVADKAKQQQEKEQGWFGSMLTLPFRFIAIMFLSLGGAIIVEWICMYFFWPEAGWKHAQGMLDHELGWLSQGFMQSVIVQEPGKTATWLVQSTYDWLVVKTGMLEWIGAMQSQAARGPRNGVDLSYQLAWAFTKFQDYGLAALYTLLVFCVRLVILTLTIPLFAMAAFVGFVDGLVRRDLRKFGAGRESSYLYHKARSTMMPLVIMPWTLYLALPFSVSPLLVLLPCAALLGISVSITASSFKKYL
ncbi:TIGR03747 family integrating conjugative element membrane protein [Pseudomonas cichorii]|uniref:TIGR03747 family integrating conjugative element membrane protein n=1 Tax=Pseudomonas cichorii TaxID=36746 RepID=UPI0018E5E7E0|nr:TIGR03747 family integrating conjugative element membrane protein [Pseudomonas cichorii]MBI6855535.1 TIGR03747 family integrating conjugative element membrane protein [Pseudomonas cichorii]